MREAALGIAAASFCGAKDTAESPARRPRYSVGEGKRPKNSKSQGAN